MMLRRLLRWRDTRWALYGAVGGNLVGVMTTGYWSWWNPVMVLLAWLVLRLAIAATDWYVRRG